MNFNEIINELEKATIFDLHRLRCAISKLIDSPERLDAVKRSLTVGMQIRYFDFEENRDIEATILTIKRTKVLVQNIHDRECWNIPFFAINLENVDTDIGTNVSKAGSLTKASLKVGDNVGWWSTKNNKEMFGHVIKLNPKRAVVQLSSGESWTIPYSMLFPVVNGEAYSGGNLLIEGEVIGPDLSYMNVL